MNRTLIAAAILSVQFLCYGTVGAAGSPFDPAKIQELAGLPGKWNEAEKVLKLTFPRKDLEVHAAGVHITPPMGLTAWAAFTPVADRAMVMGDIVMTEEQVNPVMSVALDSGLEVTALHNHFFEESPRIMFMHIGGMGAPEPLAKAVGRVFRELKETASKKPGFPQATIDPPKDTRLDPKKIDAVFGKSGSVADGVYKISFGRTVAMGGHAAGNEMGVNTWAAFVGTDERAVVDGDFAMREEELQGVLKVLRHAGIQIVAIHNHMTQEAPRMVFLHYWGVGPASSLALGIQSALKTQSK